MDTSDSTPRSALEAASPSTGGEFLLHLLQQRRPPSTLPAFCGRVDHNGFGDEEPFHGQNRSSVSGGAECVESSSFSRASASEARYVEEEQERAHPAGKTFPLEASVLDEEQARFTLQQDPAVAAMGPSHPVSEVRAIAANLGNAAGDASAVFPFYDRFSRHQPQPNQLCQHQHFGLPQVRPPSPFDVSFPRPPPLEHRLSFPADPPLPSIHNQLLTPYSYPRLPSTDHNIYVHVPSPTSCHARLLIPDTSQGLSPSLLQPALDQLNSFPNDGLVNGQQIVSSRILPSNSRPSVSLPLSENGSASPRSQVYTQFGSIPVEMPHAEARPEPAHLDRKGSVAWPSHHLKGDKQHELLMAEATRSNSGTHVCRPKILEHAAQSDSTDIYCDDGRMVLERCSFVSDVLSTAPFAQKSSHQISSMINSEGIRDVSDVETILLDNESETAKVSSGSKRQTGADITRKARIGLNHWVPVMKDKRVETSCNRIEPAAVPDDETNQAVREAKDPRYLNHGWRSKQPNPPHGLSRPQPVNSPLSQQPRSKASLQQDPLGLPSGSRVESAPSSATEQSKQALQVSHNADTPDLRAAEGSVPSPEPSVDSSLERAAEHVGKLAKSFSLLESCTQNEGNKIKRSTSQAVNLDSREVERGITRSMVRLNRREPFHRLDTNKCTSTLLTIFETLIPPDDEKQRRKHLLAALDELVTEIWPDARLYLFGSCANGFGVRNSDIDVCLSIEGESAVRSEVVCILADALKSNQMQNVQALTHARVPIVKYSDPKTGVSCDVCVNNMLAVVNTKLLHDYAQIDARLRQLAFMVKHWAKSRQVNETYRGTLSSYAYVLMCIHFLQQRKPPILPCLQEMEPTYRVTVGDIECAYFDEVDKLIDFGQKNKETLADLMALFFDYWAFRHDYTRAVISIRTGKFLSKAEKDWTRRIGNERHLICIEDPFEISHDLGRVVDKHSIQVLREEFRRAARIIRQEANPCAALFEPYIRQKAQAT